MKKSMIRTILPSGLIAMGLTMAGSAVGASVWIGNGADNDWGTVANWTAPGIPVPRGAAGDEKGVFNVPAAKEAQVSDTRELFQFVQGDNGPGGVVRVVNGGHLITSVHIGGSSTVWGAVGYNAPAHTIVEAGGTMSFGNHAWIGLLAGAEGTLDINGGTVNVGQQLGIGWNGGTGLVNVRNGGILNLFQMAGGTNSIKENSLLDVIGSGKVTLPGNQTATFQRYIDANRIAGNGVPGNVQTSFGDGFTTLTAIPIPEPSALGLLGLVGAGLMLARRRPMN